MVWLDLDLKEVGGKILSQACIICRGRGEDGVPIFRLILDLRSDGPVLECVLLGQSGNEVDGEAGGGGAPLKDHFERAWGIGFHHLVWVVVSVSAAGEDLDGLSWVLHRVFDRDSQ